MQLITITTLASNTVYDTVLEKPTGIKMSHLVLFLRNTDNKNCMVQSLM